MIRLFRRLAPLPLLASAGIGLALVFAPGRRELAFHVYLLVLAALALGRLVILLRDTHPTAATSPFDLGLVERVAPPAPLAELARLEREVSLSRTTAFDVHYRLRPGVQRIARRLLAARRGVDLERDPARAESLLGPEAWELVRPDREPPLDRAGPGLNLRRIGAVVDALEAL